VIEIGLGVRSGFAVHEPALVAMIGSSLAD
jgi:hypothetical protein